MKADKDKENLKISQNDGVEKSAFALNLNNISTYIDRDLSVISNADAVNNIFEELKTFQPRNMEDDFIRYQTDKMYINKTNAIVNRIYDHYRLKKEKQDWMSFIKVFHNLYM